MRLAQILATLKTEPLLCASGYRETLLEIFEQHALLSAADYKHKRTGKAKSGDELEIDEMEIVNGVAIIPIGGPIGQGLGEFEKGAGAVDVDDIRAELQDAEMDGEVGTILLNFDSPGGMVMGTPELGMTIAKVGKPIYSWTRGHMESAAYWLACATDGIFCTPTASVGSIGVCASILDLSKMAEMKGIKVKAFSSGIYKGMGNAGVGLTAQQEVFFQNRVMQLAEQFYTHVRSQRGAIDDDDMQGQSFNGNEALEKGLVDGVMDGCDDLMEFLEQRE